MLALVDFKYLYSKVLTYQGSKSHHAKLTSRIEIEMNSTYAGNRNKWRILRPTSRFNRSRCGPFVSRDLHVDLLTMEQFGVDEDKRSISPKTWVPAVACTNLGAIGNRLQRGGGPCVFATRYRVHAGRSFVGRVCLIIRIHRQGRPGIHMYICMYVY